MPSHAESVQQVMSSGIESLSLVYEAVRQFSSPLLYVRTSLYINSLELGQLTPEQYRYVVQRTSQAEHLFRRHLHKLLEKIPGFLAKPGPLHCFTVPAYGRMLKSGTLSRILFEELTAHPQVSASRVGIELSADLLFEDLEPMIRELKKVRELGVKIILTEVGDSFCPTLRLIQVPFDLAFLDPYAIGITNTEQEPALEALCTMLHGSSRKAFAVNLEDESLLEQLERVGCDGYSLPGEVRTAPEFSQDGDAPQ